MATLFHPLQNGHWLSHHQLARLTVLLGKGSPESEISAELEGSSVLQ
jgi:hypothetical protein